MLENSAPIKNNVSVLMNLEIQRNTENEQLFTSMKSSTMEKCIAQQYMSVPCSFSYYSFIVYFEVSS